MNNPEKRSGLQAPLPWMTRRDFLQWTAAITSMLATEGCTRQPLQKILPYTKQPEEIVPGKPLFYATAMTMGAVGSGVLVESHLGRPTKIEGNPEHPGSLGASDRFQQAAILGLYDPDRSQAIRHRDTVGTWGSFVAEVQRAMQLQAVKKGSGLRLLTETISSPTLIQQMHDLLAKYPAAKWLQYDPVGRTHSREGLRRVFGAPLHPRYHLARADVVLSLECDFLFQPGTGVRQTRDFSSRRAEGSSALNRLYVIESTPTNTGAMADHRFPMQAAEIANISAAIARLAGLGVQETAPLAPVRAKWAKAIATDLRRNAGRCLVLAGDSQPPVVHALAHALNHRLGNVGVTVDYSEPIGADPGDEVAELKKLVTEMNSGSVEAIFIFGGNPAYDAPADLGFATALARVPFAARLALYDDETSQSCHWHVPETHFLEAWGDARASDGTASIVQPLIAPLYDGKSAHEILAAMSGNGSRDSYTLVRDYWKAHGKWSDFERGWRRALHDGIVAGTALPARPVSPRPPSAWYRPVPVSPGFEIQFRPDPTIWDGRFANNPWLQELPKPLTKLTWDNAALLGPATARKLGVETGDIVEITYSGRRVKAPAFVMEGQPEESVAVSFGYGRARAGRVGNGHGFNAFALRPSDAFWSGIGAVVKRTAGKFLLAHTRDHASMEGRDLARAAANMEEIRRLEEKAREEAPPEYLAPEMRSDLTEYAWGMTIDLGACVGCSACVVACQAENNIPSVGKEEVLRGREMHWIRVDRYLEGAPENPETRFQPVPCMHCETAPCEYVCPVEATTHSDEGLNQMTYNRCVGTRYCSNNCPYKVRRFNFFQYSDLDTPILKLSRNPDVTVRTRGVMEKCSYCVQRINAARIGAELEDRSIRDGEIRTACQQACPAGAIVFGNLKDPGSEVSRRKASPLNYALLSELNTRPRTTYLAKRKNPNPEI